MAGAPSVRPPPEVQTREANLGGHAAYADKLEEFVRTEARSGMVVSCYGAARVGRRCERGHYR